jgi:hypothetical protein
MSDVIACKEFQRLCEEYEVALRVWNQYAYPVTNNHGEMSAPEAVLLLYKAKLRRDAAGSRVQRHKENCAACLGMM